MSIRILSVARELGLGSRIEIEGEEEQTASLYAALLDAIH
jgi:hypothetical protein